MKIFSSRLANFIPLLTFFSIAALHLLEDKLGENYLTVTAIVLGILFLANIGLIYTRFKEGRLSKSRILISLLLMMVVLGTWTYYVFFS